jgi:hypothetical protein
MPETGAIPTSNAERCAGRTECRPPAGYGFRYQSRCGLLHVWLPLAHTVAPTPASAVLSGSMIKAGLLGWIRFLPPGGGGDPAWGAVFIAAGITAAFYGVAIGLGQKHPKTVLAYSSISQMGLITVAFGIGLTLGAGPPLRQRCPVLCLPSCPGKGRFVFGCRCRGRHRTTVAEEGMGDGSPWYGRPGAGWSTVDHGRLGQDRPQNGDGSIARRLGKDLGDPIAFVGHRHHNSDGSLFLHAAVLAPIIVFRRLKFLLDRIGRALRDRSLSCFPSGGQLASAMLKPGSIWLSFWPVAAGTGLTAWVWWMEPANRARHSMAPAGRRSSGAGRMAVGSGGRLASTLMDKAAWGSGRMLRRKPKNVRDDGIPKRIEIWEAALVDGILRA